MAAQKEYLSCAETAKLLREALKAEFPGQKFSVRSKTYAGGASITVRYTDGPTKPDVQAVCDRYRGASFDGMIDLKSYHDTILVGEDGPQVVHLGADFIFAERDLSQEIVSGIAAMIEHLSGESCDLGERGWDKDWRKSYPLCVVRGPHDLNVMVPYAGREDASTLVHQWAHDKDFR